MINSDKNMENRQVKRNKPCSCGSGLKYKKCCMNNDEQKQLYKNPIRKLLSFGKVVKMNEDECIEVGITAKSFLLDGMFVNPIPPKFNRIVYIPISSVVDYNSIWEITRTGWYSDDVLEHPYLNIDNLWIRWDNQNLRMDCGIYHWDDKNRELFKKLYFKLDDNKKEPIIIFESTKTN